MSQTRDKPTYFRALAETPDDEIVIAGISGRFPGSRDMAELEYNLYNKVDLIDDSEVRWRHEIAEIPKRTGKIHGLENFDATFFGIHFKQAHAMDPQARILIEHAYEAILDAGINPKSLRGSRTAVYVGSCFNESEKTWFYEKVSSNGFGITGCSRAMLANRISYVLGLEGQSFLVDTACSSSMTALDCAFTAIRCGECDAAIVGASNLLLHPYLTLQFARLGVLAPNGFCRPFDEDATGYTRSEAISCIFLQRAKDAKRIYGTVLYSKINCDGYKNNGITYPSGVMQAKLLTDFYKEIHIKPETVDYVEAHSTGTVVGDPEECIALDTIFCKNRKIPLPVGSVKSNLGHTESTAGLCSIAKCILALENELIPPNINFTKLRTGIKSLEENRLQVVADAQKLAGPLIGINSFGFGGANAHCLLRANLKHKINNGTPSDKLPRLINWSGRTEEACNQIHDNLSNKPLDVEYVALLQNTQTVSNSSNIFKSYGLYEHVEGESAKCLARDVQHYSGIKIPIVYVFSGMGSQWAEMGTSLMEIPIFRESIQKCHNVLLSKGMDLINIITSPDQTTFDNILNSFVGIASIQIAICDVLRELGVEPDYIIGHSVGELGCAYADNCLTAEQMILCAYSRGLASIETKSITGSMAAVGMGYRNIRNLLSPTIDVACHNSADSCTISGPQDEVEKVVANLTAQNIFAKEVPCSNIAYHSRYISDMGPKLLGYLSEIITEPKQRSDKWLSSSVPKNKWELPESQYCSAQYQTNNLLSSVLFEETAHFLPQNATTIEIAPHGLLQAIIRKSMPNSVHIPLTQRGNKDNLNFFLQALGKIYITGVDMAIENIYPKVEFPVSRGTPRISHLIRWDHSEDWYVMKFEAERNKSGERRIAVRLQDLDFEYVSGHVIDGRCLFPATAYLHMVWETLAVMKGEMFTNLNVQFEDVRFMRATSLTRESDFVFIVMIQSGTGRFEITEGSTAVVTGYIKEIGEGNLIKLPPVEKTDYPYLPTKDFYKELRLRGYHYNGAFKNVLEARTDGLHGKIKWENNWVSFMDCLLQICILGKDTRGLMLPTRIEKLTIDTKLHFQIAHEIFDHGNPESYAYEVSSNKNLNITQSGGVEVKGLHASAVGRRKPPGIPILEEYTFMPYLPTPKLSIKNAARICVQHALENHPIAKIRVVEVLDELIEPIINTFKDAIEDLPLAVAETMILTAQEIKCDNIHVEDGKLSSQSNCMFIIKPNCLGELMFVEGALASLLDDGYLVSREVRNLLVDSIVTPQGLKLIAVIPIENETLVFLQKVKRRIPKVPTIVKITSNDKSFKWLEALRIAIKAGAVIAYSEKEIHSGIIGLINCIRKEPESNTVTCVLIDDPTAPKFDIENPFYKNQLAQELSINVYRNGQWGTYRHLSLEKPVVFAPTKEHAFANITQKGDLSSMRWIRGPLTDFIDETKKPARIQYSSLNFRDVMLATGKISVEVVGSNRLDQECVLGLEYSGIDATGKRLMGMIMAGAMATHIIPDQGLTWNCPKHWTLEQAATVPAVYATVYSALFLQGRVEPGNSILIHAGTGGVGLAAIRVALSYKMNVFTTVSTNEKKQFLLNKFPELKECQIGNSRDNSFEEMIKLQTNGDGVDYVLNSLAGEKLHASIRCLGKGGRFLEIGKFDMANDTKIGLGDFLKEMSFHAILVDNLFLASDKQRMVLKNLMQTDIDNGIIEPLPTTVYAANEIEKAMRYLASAKHMGKVLLKIRENPNDEMSLPISLIPRVNCDRNASYIIPGGLGGFGLELADWLIIRGARKLVLSSSRGIGKPYQSHRIRLWQNYGAIVVVNTSDIGTFDGCLELIKDATKLGPVGGIFNLAVLLRDNIFENQTADKFEESFRPKAYATKYLDVISRKLCPQLKYFVVFSSVSCGRGNAGQSNYGMANSIMERIIEQRHRDHLPAKAVQWGAVGEVGLVADMQEDKLDMEIGGTLQQRISSCLEELDTLLFGNCPIVSSMVVAEKRVMGGGGDIIATVMNIMSIRDIKSVSMDATLSELGMDSLMAVEIKQSLEREYDLFLTPQDLRSLTFAKLHELADAKENAGEKTKIKLTGVGLTGIQMLFRSLGDEAKSLSPVLRLKSNNNSDQFDSAIIVIPGMEGVVGSAWTNIAKALSQPTFCVQLRSSIGLKTISDITNSIYEHIYNEVTKHTDSFYIVGYSFGSFVTLQLAYMLEKSGLAGQVVLIDGAPEFFKKLAYGQFQNGFTDEAIQIYLACGIIRTIYPEEDQEDLAKRISEIPTWPERVVKLLELAQNQNLYSQEYLKDVTEGLYERITIMTNFKEEDIPKIKSPITLIRPTDVSIVDIDEDYDLKKYTDGGVNLKFIEGNHATMLENPLLPLILNEINPRSKSDIVFQKFINNPSQTIG